MLVEGTRLVNIGGVIFGTFPDYWNGVEDGRVDSPFIGREQWNDILLGNGFSGIDIALDDLPQPASTVSTMLTTAVKPIVSPLVGKLSLTQQVFVVYKGEIPVFARTIIIILAEKGVE